VPWLVVEGAGSWSPNLGREWVDDDRRFPPAHALLDDQGHPRHGYWKTRAKIYRAGAHKVDEEVARQAIATGYAWLIVMPDDNEPVLGNADPPTGVFTPEDIKDAKGAGVRLLRVVEGEDSGEPQPEAEPVFEHECRWCLTIPRKTFPSTASLDRHVEFVHPAQFSMGYERALEAARVIAEEREALRRVSDHDKPVPVWDREAVAAAGLPEATEPDPTIPQAG
jgi:hypothetical protein